MSQIYRGVSRANSSMFLLVTSAVESAISDNTLIDRYRRLLFRWMNIIPMHKIIIEENRDIYMDSYNRLLYLRTCRG